MAHHRSLLAVSLLLLFCCKEHRNEISSGTPTDHEHVAQQETVLLTKDTETTETTTPATFVLDTTGLAPEPDTPLKLLLEGTYHKNEVWGGAEKKKWLGLYYDNGSYILRTIALQVSTVEDPVLDNEGVLSGRKVIASDSGAVFMLTGLNRPSFALIDTAVISRTTIPAYKTLTYTFGGKNYAIHAFGDSAQVPTGGYTYRNYGWKAAGTKNGKKIEQLLAEDEYFDDSIYVLLWAGDLDNDGIPDLLLDLSNHYNVTRYTLFLSSKAARGKLYKKVAVFEAVGC